MFIVYVVVNFFKDIHLHSKQSYTTIKYKQQSFNIHDIYKELKAFKIK